MKRIIIVEDNRDIREGFAEVIQASGNYDVVHHYDNCEDALRHLGRDCPDVVLMDIDLPGMSGIEGTSRILKQYPGTLVLIITVYEDSDKVFKSLWRRCSGIYCKEFGHAGSVARY